ncbi:MAG TPA: SDR family NAD(P)-dependent oxidoreductase [Candidatus Binatus sp.]|uniref:SDR family NAD(P)-dependent oxidoreductase n=1 Tax=Candidatus Binatus sp. TaxID=2811406 RepID=UPI002B498573|nr:SDR family NAD(P)-dependent oxidoreductase [Candidatus Binatus sp.]HKN15228.1 SDR family NAD(P)-dependent oxidoreductase [Candidatus Binatus sp.]
MSNSTPEKSAKVCVVVGVGEGLGMALALRFAAGYKVALIARSPEVIGKTSGEIKSAGGVALPVQSDATIESEIAAAHERIHRELGPIEILIYNGGRRPMGRLMDTTPQVFEETWRLHTFGAFLWARQVVPEMLSRGGGAILITGATAGIRPWPTSAGFAPAKFAVRGLAEVMSRDLHPQGIHVAYVNVDGRCSGSSAPIQRTKTCSSRRRSPTRSGTWHIRIGARGVTSSTSDRSRKNSKPGVASQSYGA